MPPFATFVVPALLIVLPVPCSVLPAPTLMTVPAPVEIVPAESVAPAAMSSVDTKAPVRVSDSAPAPSASLPLTVKVALPLVAVSETLVAAACRAPPSVRNVPSLIVTPGDRIVPAPVTLRLPPATIVAPV